MLYRISEAARLLNVSTNSLRIWEKQGFIPIPNRRPTRIREYSESDLEAIKLFLNKRNK